MTRGQMFKCVLKSSSLRTSAFRYVVLQGNKIDISCFGEVALFLSCFVLFFYLNGFQSQQTWFL